MATATRAGQIVKQLARDLGFDLVGIASAAPFAEEGEALRRLRDGLMAGLPWYTEARVRRGAHPEVILPGARSIIAVGMSYNAPETAEESGCNGGQGPHPMSLDVARDSPSPTGGRSARSLPLGERPRERASDESRASGPRGKVARYARGDDYHKLMKRRLRAFVEGVSARLDRPVRAYGHVDDGPMLDRAAAVRAGLGWYGKNACVLTPSHGSWVLLGLVVTNLELEPDAPLKKTCGACARCIDACPTGAIVAPGVIDNARCISYLTIENRGEIPRGLRPLVGDWVFGCDICQEVCPVNRKAAEATEPAFRRRGLDTLELVALLSMTQEEFQSRFQGTSIKRAKLAGLKRNACVVLGNLADPSAVPALAHLLSNAAEPGMVRGHAAWALGRIGGAAARHALSGALEREMDADVREEARAALAETGGT